MNKNSTFLYGALAVIVILVFLLVLYFLGRENSQPATVNDKVTGFYGAAPINNRCSVQPITEPTTLLPSFDLPQNCDENYTCVQTGVNGNPFGYCKVPISSTDYLQPIYTCNTVYDCAPSTNPDEIVYCNGTCQTTTLTNWNSKSPKTYGGLYSYCDFNKPCDSGLVCDNVLNNFTTSYGECLIDFDNNGLCNTGSSFGCCTANEQCIYGLCDFNRGENGYGICISRIDPAVQCDVDFCETGFGCDFSSSLTSENLCQPLLGTNNPVVPAVYGQESSFCKIGTVSGSNDFMACDAGLICNFDLSLNGINNTNYPVSNYPTLAGIGQCVKNKVSLGNTCNVGVGCEEPLVCNNGTCSIPGYLFASNSASQTPDVNYCGPEKTSLTINYPINGSSLTCLNGYTCKNTNMGIFSDSDFCVGVPESTTAIGLCNSSTSGSYGNICGTTGGGTGCGGRYIGVFLQGYSYLGVWRFIELPDQTKTIYQVNANSKISVYQTVDTSGNSNYPLTKIIFYPNNGLDNGNIFFYYTEFSTYYIDPNGENNLKFTPFYSSGTQPYSIPWRYIHVNVINGTTGGNLTKYINNSTEETTALTGYTDGSIGSYTHLEYQLVSGGGSGGGSWTDTGVDFNSKSGGGGGSGNIEGYLGGTSNGVTINSITYDFNYNETDAYAGTGYPTKRIVKLGTNFNVTVQLGTGGAGGAGYEQLGNNGGNTILTFQNTSNPLDPITNGTITVTGGTAGETGNSSNCGAGGSGFNGGGGGGNVLSSSSFGVGGIGDISNGGQNGDDGETNGALNKGGDGGGINPGQGGNSGSSDIGSSAGGGGAAGPVKTTFVPSGAPARTGGQGTWEDNSSSYGGTDAIDYTGGGGGGASIYADLGQQRVSTSGGKGFAILYFYNESDDYSLNALYDIKFSSAGNIALFLNETGPVDTSTGFVIPGINSAGSSKSNYNRIYLLDISTLDFNDGRLFYVPSDYGPLWTQDDVTNNPTGVNPNLPSPATSPSVSDLEINKLSSYYNPTSPVSPNIFSPDLNTVIWDVDDLYNNSIVIGLKNGTDVDFWSELIPTSPNGLQDLSTLSTKTNVAQIVASGVTYPNYVKYFTDFKHPSSDVNFLYNYNNSVDILEVNTSSTSSPYVVNLGLTLSPALTYAINFSRYGTLNNFIFYYMANNGEIRTSTVTRDKTGNVSENEENVYGYAPAEIVNYDTNKSRMMSLTSMGNIDNSLYALVETCT